MKDAQSFTCLCCCSLRSVVVVVVVVVIVVVTFGSDKPNNSHNDALIRVTRKGSTRKQEVSGTQLFRPSLITNSISLNYRIFRSPAPTAFLHPPTHFMYICVSCAHILSNLKACLTLRQSSSCASYRYVICHTFPNK